MAAGARTAYLIDEPLAAAIGAKIPIAQAAGHMIINIGGGSTECAVISLGGVVVSTSVRVAGNKIDEAIALYVRKKFNLLIGERTAEEIKITIGNAFIEEEKGRAKGGDTDTKMEVRGRDSVSGLPRTIEITEVQVNEAITPVLMEIVKGAKGVMEQTPPELASDIIDKGVVMSGGSSLLKNIDKLMTHTTGVPCHVAEDPLLCVVRGTGVAVENIELYKRSIIRR
jgi:rod shape-determining protein MreB